MTELDRNTQHSKEPQMARNIPLPDGGRLDLDQEIDGHLLDRTPT